MACAGICAPTSLDEEGPSSPLSTSSSPSSLFPMPQSSVTQAATGVCTKDTVKKTGLNVWASGERDGNAPDVE